MENEVKQEASGQTVPTHGSSREPSSPGRQDVKRTNRREKRANMNSSPKPKLDAKQGMQMAHTYTQTLTWQKLKSIAIISQV